MSKSGLLVLRICHPAIGGKIESRRFNRFDASTGSTCIGLLKHLFSGGLMNAKSIISYAAEHEAKFVSGAVHRSAGCLASFTYPIHNLTEDVFEDGFGFDASSLRGWAAINESDMLLIRTRRESGSILLLTRRRFV
jgi:hypothetical protein